MRRILTLLIATMVMPVLLNAQTNLKPLRFKTATVFPKSALELEEAALSSELFAGYWHGIVQFKNIPSAEQLKAMQDEGIILGAYLPDNAYLVQLPAAYASTNLAVYGASALLPFSAEWKCDARLQPVLRNEVNGTERIKVNVICFNKDMMGLLPGDMQQVGATVLETAPLFGRLLVEVEAGQLKTLLQRPWVSWIEPETPDMQINNLPGKTLIRSNVLGSKANGARNLQGTGVIVGVWDGGQAGVHVDLASHQTNLETALGVSSHATHVTGTIAGAGLKDPDATGMAPEATIFNWDFSGDIPSEMGTAIPVQKIVATSNSYAYNNLLDSCSFRGEYDSRSSSLDQLVNSNPYLTHVFAAGNFQNECSLGGFRTVHSGSQATKNVIVVGAVDRNDAMSNFSAWGPMRDNRIKPEVVATGVAVNSTYPNNTYSSTQGTSMAAPAVTGVVAQLYQRYRQLKNGNNPDATLIRGVLTNSAEDLGNPGPDFKFGFGRINALKAVTTLEQERYFRDTVTNNGTKQRLLNVPSGCKKLKVTLVWNDPAAALFSAISLVNNLNLTLTSTASGNGTLPWVLNAGSYNATATRATDTLNNIEQVTIDNPDSAYLLSVKGATVTNGQQIFYLVYEFEMPAITITYPNGGETFVPAATELIRWDARHLSGNLQLHYSVDGGTNWTLISNSLASSTKQFSWTIPNSVTGKALIRVRTADSSTTDMSDTLFAILGTPGSLTGKICDRQIHLTWGSVTGAIAYEPQLLVNGAYQAMPISANRFYTFTNLSNGTEYWVTVRAIGPDSVKGKRAIALNFTPSSANVATGFTTDLAEISSACLNSSITLKTKTVGAATLSRQWQRSTNGGTIWNNITGSTDSLLITPVTALLDNYRYRLQLTSSTCGNTVYSYPTTLRVDTGLVITHDQPAATACYNAPITLSYGVVSKSLPFTRWQLSKNGTGPWNTFATDFDSSISFTAIDTLDGYMIRAIASNGCVAGDTTAATSITVKQKLLMQVNADTATCAGSPVTLTAQFSGGASTPVVQWQGLGSNYSYTVNPVAGTTYYVTAGDTCTATITDSVRVTVTVADSNWTHDATGQNAVHFTPVDVGANAYLWDFGDGQTGNQVSPVHFYTANGNYRVCLTITRSGCSFTKCQYINITKTSLPGITSLQNSIRVYPNPASVMLHLETPVSVKQIELSDNLGRVLYRLEGPANGRISIPLTNCGNGMCWIKISTAAGIVHKKVFVLK